ncbi:GrpB family protein [Methylobacterium nonmethylotrophicum]|uniref:GrpB family protein n=1 Tax=Methylobacterium nonmethylotrophicum TaxID=1141884 RepID=A0A4Z0NP23_9HYPH|nr:GrpB family protein [Methylobacterium nonmethylotrophicum]TGD98580.1 hypothetical protein EU555_14640 [Methylobacterium nonmethylotrophicum]
MAHGEIFVLAPDPQAARAAADRLFAALAGDLAAVLPATAELLHVGATAIPGCLTKGDLDIVVRVEAADFAQADAALAGRFTRNTGSDRTEDFAAFEDGDRVPPLGIQLVVRGGAYDDFHRFAEALRRDPDRLRRYNDLKRAFHGRPMEAYRAAKGAFIASVLHAAVADAPDPAKIASPPHRGE